jgi:hypothetical protein
MASNTLERVNRTTELEAEVDRLAQLIRERFPAEMSCADTHDRELIVKVAAELLERLWRWEN